MYLKHTPSGDLVEIEDTAALFSPVEAGVRGRFHAGEELQESTTFAKADLAFPSGEALPRCWIDVHYREAG